MQENETRVYEMTVLMRGSYVNQGRNGSACSLEHRRSALHQVAANYTIEVEIN